jgi:hypothetical protein
MNSAIIMKKYIKNIFIWQASGAGILLLIVSPLIMAVYQYEFLDHQVSFRKNLFGIYGILLPPKDIDIMLFGVLISIVGVVLGTILYRYINGKLEKKLTTSQILELIENGVNEQVEFKSSLRHDYRQVKTNKSLEDQILKEIGGFLNGNGGILLIGVDNFGEIIGLANDYWSLKKRDKDGFEQRLILIISNAFGKDICSKINVAFHEIGDREICSLRIKPSSRPVYFREKNQTIFFLRTGNITNPLSTSETVEYLITKIAQKTRKPRFQKYY